MKEFLSLDGFSISITQTAILIVAIAFISHWLLEKRKQSLYVAIIAMMIFISLRSMSFWQAYTQKKIVVYNVPKHLAIDLIAGRAYNFVGDSDLLTDDFIRNFHLQPSRVAHRIQSNQIIPVSTKEFTFCNKRMMIIDSTTRLIKAIEKPLIDILILSKNPKIYISNLTSAFTINTVVIDGSVPMWKAKLWKKDCDSLKIPCYNVSEQGAFVMNL